MALKFSHLQHVISLQDDALLLIGFQTFSLSIAFDAHATLFGSFCASRLSFATKSFLCKSSLSSFERAHELCLPRRNTNFSKPAINLGREFKIPSRRANKHLWIIKLFFIVWRVQLQSCWQNLNKMEVFLLVRRKRTLRRCIHLFLFISRNVICSCGEASSTKLAFDCIMIFCAAFFAPLQYCRRGISIIVFSFALQRPF